MNANIAKQAGISERHLYYLLEGRRNATPGVATSLEQATGVARELWVFGTPEERRAAWQKMKKEARP